MISRIYARKTLFLVVRFAKNCNDRTAFRLGFVSITLGLMLLNKASNLSF